MPLLFVREELASGAAVSVLEESLWRSERTVHAILVEGRLAPARVRRFVTDLGRAAARNVQC
jgi:DNA-binding transcriptional LysR family regulator